MSTAIHRISTVIALGEDTIYLFASCMAILTSEFRAYETRKGLNFPSVLLPEFGSRQLKKSKTGSTPTQLPFIDLYMQVKWFRHRHLCDSNPQW